MPDMAKAVERGSKAPMTPEGKISCVVEETTDQG